MKTASGTRITCPECCSAINVMCGFCGEYPDECDCGRDEMYCLVCDKTFSWHNDDTFEIDPVCVHDIALYGALVCDDCDVYRESIEEDWHWQHTHPFCRCSPEKSVKCAKCGVVRDDPLAEWQWEEADGGSYYYTYKCRHYDQPVVFPNGVKVYASSMRDRENGEDAPDFGLYLDGGWNPSCMNHLVGWADYGLPRHWELAADMIVDAYRRAADGQWVEVGCIGGHGRTGTALACMAVLAGVPFDEAPDWVRVNYCPEAGETDEQAWWVEWFSVYVNGGVTSEEPYPYWMTKKQKKHHKRKSYKMPGFDWENCSLFDPKHGKPAYEYGAVLSRSVRLKKDKKEEEVLES